MIELLLLVLLVALLIGALPRWPHSSDWGNTPAGLVAVVLLVLIALYVLGYRL